MDDQKDEVQPEVITQQPESAPEKRKAGRPRREGVERNASGRIKPPRKADVLPEVSLARQVAGARGQAVLARKKLLEGERRKLGREQQPVFDLQHAQVKAETANLGVEVDPFYEIRSLVWACTNLIMAQIWNRTYLPPGDQSYNEENDWLDDQPEELQCELRKSFGSYPEIDAEMITGYASRIKLEQLPLTKQLVTKALEAFLDFAKYQDARVMREIERTILRVERALPRVKDGSIYHPPQLPEPQPPTATEFFQDGKSMYVEFHGKTYSNWTDLHAAQAATYGPHYSPEVMVEDLKEKERKLEIEREAQILANKTTEARKKYEEERLRQERFQQENLPSQALIFLRGYRQ